MNETRQLAQHVTQVRYEDLPKEVLDKAKQLILDQLGVELACSTKPWSKIVYEYAAQNPSIRAESTVLNFGLRIKAEDAAMVNATFGHGFEFDDTDLESKVHLGCVVIPVAMALGERESVSGKEFITAVALGYDVASRVGGAAKSAIKRGFHPTPVFAPFGAVATATKILKMNANEVLNAFGLVASHCGGLSEFAVSGGEVKRFHSGIAAHAGIRSATLARLGLTGPPTVLEGTKGFCRAFSDTYSLERMTEGLGQEFRILQTGLKPYCCCAAQHAAIDAAFGIVSKHKISTEEIEEIVVGQGSQEANLVGTIVDPSDMTAMQFSGRFGIALRLLKGGNTFTQYSEENLWDPEVRNFTKKIFWIEDNEIERTTEAGARVTMKLKDGRSLTEKVSWAKGTIYNQLTQEEMEAKFEGLASMVLPMNKVEGVIEVIRDLDKIGAIQDLMGLLVSE